MRLIVFLILQLKMEPRKLKKKKHLFDTQEGIQARLTIVNRRKYEASVREWENAIKTDPDNEVLWNNKGVSLVRLGELKKAIKCYTKAIKLNPKYENAWFNKGKALTKLEKHKDAIKCYDHVHELNPSNISAWNNKGIALRTLRRFDEAIECFDKALEIDSKYEWGWHNKGFTLSEMGRIEDAVACYDQALKINPNYQSAIRNRKRCLKILELKRREASFSSEQKVLQNALQTTVNTVIADENINSVKSNPSKRHKPRSKKKRVRVKKFHD